MPQPLLRRRRSFRPLIIGIAIVTVAALSVMGAVVKERYRRLADDSFARAQELFQSGAFAKAEREYELFRQQFPRDERARQAQAVAELCKVANKIDDPADAGAVVAALDKFSADSDAAEQVKDEWQILLTVAERTARASLDRADRSLVPGDLDAAEAWIGWLRSQQGAKVDGTGRLDWAGLDTLARQTRDRIAAESRRRAFLDAADRATNEPNVDHFAAAFRAHAAWRAGTTGPDATVTAAFERLRLALRSQIRFETIPAPSGETAAAVPLLPLADYTRLSTRLQTKPIKMPTNDPVFARVNDICFALEPATGQPLWVQRVGYDAGLPELAPGRGRRAVLVPWFRGSDAIVSLCDAASGETIWSWPADEPLAGPAAVSRDSVFVATRTGTVWQLDLETGSPRRAAQLPEPIDGPPTLREDRAGLCIVGASQAVYLIEIAREIPECSDVVLLGRRADTARCQALWVPPYVIIFENDLMNRCYARLLYQEPAGHRSVRDIELDGRLWQTPALDGARMFLVTDRWKKFCFGLDRNNPAVNLFTAATGSQIDEPPQPVRPQFCRVPVDEAPFVGVLDALRGYRVDEGKALLLETWNRPAPHADARCVQPLQVRGPVVVATWQEPARGGVLVEAVSAVRGEVVWTSRLGGAARDVAVVREAGDARIVVRGDSSGCFLLARDAGTTWLASPLQLPGTPADFALTPAGNELLYVSDGGTRVRSVSVGDWSSGRVHAQNAPARSAPAVFSGKLAIKTADALAPRSGRWALYVTADPAIEMRPLDEARDEIHAARLPAEESGGGAWPWPPLVIGSSHVIVAQPAGRVYRAEPRITDGITHLFVTEQRADLPPLAGAPMALGGLLCCVALDGKCLLLDPATLRTVADWQAATRIRNVAADGERVFLCDGTKIQAVRLEDAKLEPAWSRDLEGRDWSLAAVDRGVIFAARPSGAIVAVDGLSGQVLARIAAPAPLAAPPRQVGDQLILATIDGGVTFVAAPALQGR